jgi:hypothetical protein
VELTDRQQIIDLVHRYSDAVTRYDEVEWTKTWAVDASWDLGKGRAFSGRDAMVEFWHRAMSGLKLVIQMVHNGTVSIAGADSATGRWYVSEHLERTSGERGILLAWYDDTYVRVDGEWRFARRALTRLYAGAADLTSEFMPPPQSGWPNT